MKNFRQIVFLVFLFLPFLTKAQILGIGYNTNFNSNQFVASINSPYNLKADFKKSFYIEFGSDFTTRNPNSFSGIYIKPVQFNYNFTSDNKNKPVIEVSAEVSYLINNGLGNNGFVISSNFYIDNGNFFYLKSGFEHHINDKISQFYIRLGITVSKNLQIKTMW